MLSKKFANAHNLDIGNTIYSQEEINAGKQGEYTIGAIIEDFPLNSNFGNYESIIKTNDNDRDKWGYHNMYFYIKLNTGVDINNIEEQSYIALKNTLRSSQLNMSHEDILDREVSLKPYFRNIGESYFAENTDSEFRANKNTTLVLIAIAFIILALALINYLNFFFALSHLG